MKYTILIVNDEEKRPSSFLPSGIIANIVLCLSVVMVFVSCSTLNRLEGFVYYRLSANPATLDPALMVDLASGSIAAKIFNGLVRLNEDMEVAPDISEGWTISPDGLTYRFRLKKGIKYSNNQDVKANDIKYSFVRILDPKTRSPNIWVLDKIAGAKAFMAGRARDVSGIKVIDDHTIDIRLEKPFSPFLYLLTMPAAYIVPEGEVRSLGPDFSFHPVGTGPFVIKEWLPDRTLRLEKRDDYFDNKAIVRGIVYRIIPEDLTAVTEFELGNIDVISIPASHFRKFMDDPKWNRHIYPVKGINTYYLGMNCSRPPFDRTDIRKAVSLAIDRDKLLTTFYENRGRIASGPVPDILRKWEISSGYGYDPEKAKNIIEKEGFKNRAINFYVTADQEVVDMAEFIQAYLNKAGLRVRIKQLEWSAYKEAINRGEPDLFWLSWWADYPDPENFLFPLFHSSNFGPAGNRVRYKNSEVDRMIELGRHANNKTERAAYYGKAEKLIIRDAPWVFFWHKTDYLVTQHYVTNFKTYPVYTMDKGTEIKFRYFSG